MADITLQQFYDAMAQAAREGTLSALKTLFDSGAAKMSITGSYLQEVKVATSVSVPAGAEVTVAQNVDTNCSEFAVGARVLEGGNPFVTIKIWPEIGGFVATGPTPVETLIDNEAMQNGRTLSDRTPSKSLEVSIRILNHDTVDHTYDVWTVNYYAAKI